MTSSTPLPDTFADTYRQARALFLDAANDAGAALSSFRHPAATDPDGEPLYADLARIGSPDATRVLLCVSGTHGIEGYTGSACQVDLLRSGATRPDTAVVALHALNPFGFAHRRRVNEDNVDLNRNFVDHADPPGNDRYPKLHDALVPADWSGPSRDAADARIVRLATEWGGREVQGAITNGQWTHPDGLFYGGTAPVWSHRLLRTVATAELRGHRRIAYIDLHTGLGPWGNGEPIFRGGTGPDVLSRARTWYGDALTVSEDGTSSSTPINGNTARAIAESTVDGQALTAITLEFGTLSGLEVLDALRADNWLYLRENPADDLRRSIKKKITDAFYPDDEQWRRTVLARGREVFEQAFTGLSS
jgi:hypothetical protein